MRDYLRTIEEHVKHCRHFYRFPREHNVDESISEPNLIQISRVVLA